MSKVISHPSKFVDEIKNYAGLATQSGMSYDFLRLLAASSVPSRLVGCTVFFFLSVILLHHVVLRADFWIFLAID